MITWDGEQKQLTRMRAEWLLAQKRCRNTLWLTGYELRDIRYCLKEGGLQPNTRMIIVERDKDTHQKIEEAMKRLPFNSQVIHGQLHQQTNLPSMDYCNLDFCGTLDLDTAVWMQRWLKLNSGAAVSITLSYTERGSSYLWKVAKRLLQEKHQSLYRDVHCKVRDQNIAIQICLLCAIFRFYTFKLGTVFKYRDRQHSMMNYLLMDMRKSAEPQYPDLISEISGHSLFKGTDMVTQTAVQKELSRRARKAVRTRKAREQQEVIESGRVIDALVTAETAGEKAAATRLLNRYVDQQVELGYEETRIRAAIKAHVTRRVA